MVNMYMYKMIKDHSGSWMLSSGILTFNALSEYYGRTPGCNKSVCLSYGQHGEYSVYFSEDDVVSSAKIGNDFIHNEAEYTAYIDNVNTILKKIEEYIDNKLIPYANKDGREELAKLWEMSNQLRVEYLAFYQLTNDGFVAKTYEDVDRFLSIHNDVVDKQEVLQCLSAMDTRDLYIFRENEDWLKLVRRYLDSNSYIDNALLLELNKHASRFGFLKMGRSQFMDGANNNYYLKLLNTYTETEYKKNIARYKIQAESASYAEQRAIQCAQKLGMPDDLYTTIRRLAMLAYLRLKMREISQKLIVAREKCIMPQVYRLIIPHLSKDEFRYLLPDEITELIRGEKSEEVYRELKREIRQREEAICINFENGKINLTVGKEAKKTIKMYNTSNEDHANTYKGIPVYGKGTIIGKVIKLEENNTIESTMNIEDRIILCKSLIPHMVGACMQALAVITEEGGYSSHASVLCREMHIPCVVGANGIMSLCNDETIQIEMEHGVIKPCKKEEKKQERKALEAFVNLKDLDEEMQVGGKARQLRKLLGVTPEAFVITTEGFALYEADRENFNKVLHSYLDDLHTEHVILRSSFAEEDSHSKTYAGIFESYGNIAVKDIERIDKIIQKILKAYRDIPAFYETKYNGVSNCSIIVQKMIEPVVSGVAISGYISKGYEYILIEYVFGHLSVLMDGKVTPMRGFFRKADYYQDNRVYDLQPPLMIPSCQKQIEKLIDYIVKLEKYYSGSIEIEWAIQNDHLYLLQVRKEPTRG